ncbi:MAG: V-type ATP synthase subunit I [Thermoplasmatota archaeon]
MMSPERMRRVLFVTTREDSPTLVRALHDLRAVHIIEHTKGENGLDLGRPLPGGSEASGALVRVRSLMRHLGAEGHVSATTFRTKDVQAGLRRLDALEAEVERTIEEIGKLEAERTEREAEITKLGPALELGIPLELLRGYSSIRAFVGTIESDPSTDIAKIVGDRMETFRGSTAIALFVPIASADACLQTLLTHGFKEVEPPVGAGAPQGKLASVRADLAAVGARLDTARTTLGRIRSQNADFLAAAEEQLSIDVAKAEAPVSCGATEHALFLEAWIPESQLGDVRAEMGRVLGDKIHFEIEEDSHAHHEGAEMDNFPIESAAKKEKTQPPTKMRNPAGFGPFQFFTEMFSTPNYDEIDPTLILGIAFPVFFGFMIGDFGLGLLMLVLGALMATKLRGIEGVRELGVVIAVAGAVATVLGGLVFMDAFGIPFGFSTAMANTVSSAGLGPVACTPAVYSAIHETTWSCLLGVGPVTVNPLIAKTEDILTMLLISLFAGFIHLGIGLIFGIRNEAHHSARHAFAKVGWLILLFGFFTAALYLLDKGLLDTYHVLGYSMPFAGATIAIGVVILIFTEGGLAVMEIPSLFSNTLSYLRLGAVAVAKGAMASAFNGLTLLVALGGIPTGNVVLIVLGLVGFLLAQVILFALGLLSSGIQAIRLNYVEFFTKFYKGGGTPFRPFGRVRRFTTES